MKIPNLLLAVCILAAALKPDSADAKSVDPNTPVSQESETEKVDNVDDVGGGNNDGRRWGLGLSGLFKDKGKKKHKKGASASSRASGAAQASNVADLPRAANAVPQDQMVVEYQSTEALQAPQ